MGHEWDLDNAVVSSLQISPNNDFILTSYRIRGSKVPEPFQSIFFHIYRQLDWRLYVMEEGVINCSTKRLD